MKILFGYLGQQLVTGKGTRVAKGQPLVPGTGNGLPLRYWLGVLVLS